MLNKSDKTQSDKFKEAARELEADESETNWEQRLKKVVETRSHTIELENRVRQIEKDIKRLEGGDDTGFATGSKVYGQDRIDTLLSEKRAELVKAKSDLEFSNRDK